jgi:hypothetical protein
MGYLSSSNAIQVTEPSPTILQPSLLATKAILQGHILISIGISISVSQNKTLRQQPINIEHNLSRRGVGTTVIASYVKQSLKHKATILVLNFGQY